MLLSSSAQGRRRGFTLVELLTVIAIVAVLALLLFVGTAKIRTRLDQTTCASNMRMMGQGALLYANDNRGRLPPVDNLKDANGNYIAETSWLNVAATYYLGGPPTVAAKMETTRRIMRCPEQRKVVMEALGVGNEADLGSGFVRNFAYNYFLGPNKDNQNNWRTLASIEKPALTMMLTESGLQTTFNCQGEMNTGTIIWSTRGADGVLRKGVHGDYNNIVWVDGHVSRWEDISRMVRPPYRPGNPEDRWAYVP
jgi:prepilin-type N-terminal cleavage/methylation domain-containing protein/prepilin-type processing-associated H-X9-DG protein